MGIEVIKEEKENLCDVDSSYTSVLCTLRSEWLPVTEHCDIRSPQRSTGLTDATSVQLSGQNNTTTYAIHTDAVHS